VRGVVVVEKAKDCESLSRVERRRRRTRRRTRRRRTKEGEKK